ncbi:MAG: magnesium transporter [Lentisphaeria bacterium]
MNDTHTTEQSQKQVESLIRQERWQELYRRLKNMDPADTADLLEGVGSDKRETVFAMLDPATASDVLVELEPSYIDDLIEDMEALKLARIADEMAPDDAADFIGDMDEELQPRVLAQMKASDEIRDLLEYKEDSAGHIMTTEFCSVSPDYTVKETREVLMPLELTDPVLNIYVVDDPSGRLAGIVNLQTLFTSPPQQRVKEIMETDFVCCYADEDQEEVARKFRKYDAWVMPVVNRSLKMLGRITVDDIIDVMREEADEDLAFMVGAPDIEAETASPLQIARLRLPWLLITMVAGLVNSIIIKSMLNVTDIAAIAIFVPAIMAMGGNTGIQSSAVAIRGIALGYKTYSRLVPIVGREILVGAALGIVCGTVTGLLVVNALTFSGVELGGPSAGSLALTVGVAMGNAMVFATCFGAVVPLLLNRLGIDPAVASGPFVTTANDLSASLIYFLTCVLFLM